jgi:hypothetical protein
MNRARVGPIARFNSSANGLSRQESSTKMPPTKKTTRRRNVSVERLTTKQRGIRKRAK